jgi:hypothetical protein
MSRPTTRCQAFEEWTIAHCHTDSVRGRPLSGWSPQTLTVHWPRVKSNDSHTARKLPLRRTLQSQMLQCPLSVARAPEGDGRQRLLSDNHLASAGGLSLAGRSNDYTSRRSPPCSRRRRTLADHRPIARQSHPAELFECLFHLV